MKRILGPLLFLCLALGFWGAWIENRTEADDAYDYALQLEQGYPKGIFHPHHLLVGTVMRPAYRLATWLGYEGRAIGFMVFVSALCAAGTACLFRGVCRLHLNPGQMESLLATGFLVFSYGFWRYANEAEIVMQASVAILAAASLAMGRDRGWWKIAAAGAIAGFSATIHILNCIPAFGALPLYFLLQRQIRPLLIYGSVAASVAGLAYLLVYSIARDQVPMEFLPSAPGGAGVDAGVRDLVVRRLRDGHPADGAGQSRGVGDGPGAVLAGPRERPDRTARTKSPPAYCCLDAGLSSPFTTTSGVSRFFKTHGPTTIAGRRFGS